MQQFFSTPVQQGKKPPYSTRRVKERRKKSGLVKADTVKLDLVLNHLIRGALAAVTQLSV